MLAPLPSVTPIGSPASAKRSPDGGLAELLWSFAPDDSQAKVPRSGHELASVTTESKTMPKELKRRGFVFVGPTTAYSLMQSAGIVNDHLLDCEFRWLRVPQ